MAEAPLKGVRVIELARVLAGPWAGQLLADLGADVIKIESPEGDDTRRWGPPFVSGSNGENLSAAYYHSANRGKRSVVLDLKSGQGRADAVELARGADVLIENFKVGGLKKFGLDYESLSRINPKLVYCSITGFGQDGPYASRPGYDFIIQGMAGMMSLTGEPGREPQKAGVAIADIFTGLYAVIAIQAALLHVRAGGEGQHIDMALFDAQAAVLANHNLSYLVSGRVPGQAGNAHLNIAPYEVFPAADGHLIVAVGNDGQFRRMCEVLGLDGVADDADFASNAGRVANRDRLHDMIAGRTGSWPRDALLAALEGAGVPAGPINNIAQMFADPQAVHRGLRIDLPDRDGNVIPGVRSPILMSGTPLAYDRPSPRLGEHTDEVLGELKAGDRAPRT